VQVRTGEHEGETERKLILLRLLIYVAHSLAGKGFGDKDIPASRLPLVKRELLGYLYTADVLDYTQKYPRIRCLLLINVYPLLPPLPVP
jgi:hypothetical protein